MVCGDEAKEKQKPEGQEVGVVSYFYLNLSWKKKKERQLRLMEPPRMPD